MITEKDVERLFAPQLEKIKDEALRKQVVQVWTRACHDGGWQSVDELYTMPFTLLTETHGVSFVEHTIAVTEGAYALAKSQEAAYRKMPYEIDYDRLVAGGLLHDVGKLVEIQKDGEGGFTKSLIGKCTRHPIAGAIMAAKAGMDIKLVNTIGCHAKEGDGRPQVFETILIHPADFGTFNPLVMMTKGTLID